MSNVEELTKRVEEYLDQKEPKTTQEERNAIFALLNRLTEEIAGGFLKLDGSTYTEKIETKKVRQFVGNDKESARFVDPEDFGDYEIEKSFPAIGEVIYLMATTNAPLPAAEHDAAIAGYYQTLGELSEAMQQEQSRRSDRHTVMTSKLSQDFKTEIGTVRNDPESEDEDEKKGVFHFTSEHDLTKQKKTHTIMTEVVGRYSQIGGEVQFQTIDILVMQAVYDLIQEGNRFITPGMIWRSISQSQKATKKQEDLIIEVVTRNRLTELKIDITQEFDISEQGQQEKMKKYAKRSKDGRIRIGANLLYLKEYDYPLVINGKEVSFAWEVLYNRHGQPELPALIRHAEIMGKGQLWHIDNKYLDMHGEVSMTMKNITIRDKLLQNIHRINGSASTSRKITFKQIYSELGVDDRSRKTEKQRIRNDTKRILDQFKENGLIHDFRITTDTIEIIPPTGSLIITAEAVGADPEISFSFSIKLFNKKISKTLGSVQFDKGEAAITIMNGTPREIPELPDGTGYQITPAGSGDYTLTGVIHDAGEIKAGGVIEAAFSFKAKEDIRKDKRFYT